MAFKWEITIYLTGPLRSNKNTKNQQNYEPILLKAWTVLSDTFLRNQIIFFPVCIIIIIVLATFNNPFPKPCDGQGNNKTSNLQISQKLIKV